MLDRHSRRGRLRDPLVLKDHMSDGELQNAKASEFRASAIGAGIAGFGMGVVLAQYFQVFGIWIMLAGLALHGWGMYRIHIRNRVNAG